MHRKANMHNAKPVDQHTIISEKGRTMSFGKWNHRIFGDGRHVAAAIISVFVLLTCVSIGKACDPPRTDEGEFPSCCNLKNEIPRISDSRGVTDENGEYWGDEVTVTWTVDNEKIVRQFYREDGDTGPYTRDQEPPEQTWDDVEEREVLDAPPGDPVVMDGKKLRWDDGTVIAQEVNTKKGGYTVTCTGPNGQQLWTGDWTGSMGDETEQNTSITRGGIQTQMYYNETGGDGDVATVDKVVQGDSSDVRSLTFYHYEADGIYITRKRVTEVTFDSDGKPRIETTIYGYYGDGADANSVGKIKYVVRPQGVARYLEENGYSLGVRFDTSEDDIVSPLLECGLDTASEGDIGSLDDSDLAFYASRIIYDYDDKGREVKVAQGSGGCCGASDEGVTYYAYSTDNSGDPNDPNDPYRYWTTWKRIAHPNGLRTIQFYNSRKEVVFEVKQMMTAEQEDGRRDIETVPGESDEKVWISHNVYYDDSSGDDAGKIHERRHPSACKVYPVNIEDVTTGEYDALKGEWVTGITTEDGDDSDDVEGLVEGYEYYSESNSGRIKAKYIKKGIDGSKEYVYEREYTSNSANEGTVWRLWKDTVYDPAMANPGTGDGYTTTYQYTYDPTVADRVLQKTVTFPAVNASHNGPGGMSGQNVVYHYHSDDANGLYYNDWTKHEDGTFSYREVGAGTWTHGRVVKEVRDVHENCNLTPPTGWTLPSDEEAVGLTTLYEYYDDPANEGSLGRLKRREEDGIGSNEIETVYAYKSRRTFGDHITGCDRTMTTTHTVRLSSVCDEEEYNNVSMSIEVSDMAGRTITSASGVPDDYVTGDNDLMYAFEYGDAEDNETGYFERDYSFGQVMMTLVAGFKGRLTSHTEVSYVYDMNDSGGLESKTVDRWSSAEDDQKTILTSKTIYDKNTGRVKRTINDDGTVSEPVYDQLGRLIETKQAASTGHSLVTVSKQFYDEVGTSNNPSPGSERQGVGDGYVTQRQSVYEKDGQEEHYATLSTYDYRGRLTESEAGGLVTKYSEASSPHAVKVRTVETYVVAATETRRSKQETYYDERGRVFQTRSYADQAGSDAGNYLVTNQWYDARGRLIKTSDSKGLFRKVRYDGLGRQVASYVCYDLDETSYADANDVDGDTVAEQSKTVYNSAGQPIKQWSYQRHDDATGEGELTKDNARVSLVATWYDEVGRPIRSASYGALEADDWNVAYTDLKDYDPNDGAADTYATCDVDSTPLPDSHDNVRVSRTQYDPNGRPYKQIGNTGRQTRLVFNDLGQTIKTIENYQDGDVTTGTTDEDRTTEYVYDSSGRLDKIKATNIDPEDGSVTYQETAYSYDDSVDASRATETTYPDNGKVIVTYDRLGRVLTSTNQNDTVHTFVYDSTTGKLLKDRVTRLGGADDYVQSVVYAYDDLGRVETITTYADNDGGGTVRSQIKKTYGDWGQLTRTAQEHGGTVDVSTPTVQYDPNVSGSDEVEYVRLKKITYPDGREITYNHGAATDANSILGRVESLVDNDDQILAEYTYLGAGTIVQAGRPEVTGGLTLSYGSGGSYSGIDRFGQITDHAWKKTSGTAIDRFEYGYDRGGNRTWRKSSITHADANLPELDEQYLYDGLDRLIKVNRGTLDANNEITDTNADFSQAWATWNAAETRWDSALDSVGNWDTFQQDDTGGGAGGSGWDLDQSRTHNAVNEITATSGASWAQPVHDDAGNMTTAPAPGDEANTAHEYVYDAWNRLVAVYEDLNHSGDPDDAGEYIAKYQYDGLGRRIVRTDCTGASDVTYHDYYTPGWQLIEVRKNGKTDAHVHKQYVWGLRYIDAPVLRDRETDAGAAGLDERLYYTQDGNFNVTALVNPAGQVVERYSYDAYGQVTVLDGDWSVDADGLSDVDNRILYCGYRFDSETGLYHVRFRYLHPILGRWTSQDPLGYVESQSLYQYSLSSPVVYADAIGLKINSYWIQEFEARSLRLFGRFKGHEKYAYYWNMGRYLHYRVDNSTVSEDMSKCTKAIWRLVAGGATSYAVDLQREAQKNGNVNITNVANNIATVIENAQALAEHYDSSFKTATNMLEWYAKRKASGAPGIPGMAKLTSQLRNKTIKTKVALGKAEKILSAVSSGLEMLGDMGTNNDRSLFLMRASAAADICASLSPMGVAEMLQFESAGLQAAAGLFEDIDMGRAQKNHTKFVNGDAYKNDLVPMDDSAPLGVDWAKDLLEEAGVGQGYIDRMEAACCDD